MNVLVSVQSIGACMGGHSCAAAAVLHNRVLRIGTWDVLSLRRDTVEDETMPAIIRHLAWTK